MWMFEYKQNVTLIHMLELIAKIDQYKRSHEDADNEADGDTDTDANIDIDTCHLLASELSVWMQPQFISCHRIDIKISNSFNS